MTAVPMAPLEVGARAARLQAAMVIAGLDCLIVTDLTNVRWLTGFTGSAGRAVVRTDDVTLVVDGRYGEQARQQLAGNGVTAQVLVGLSGAELLDHLAVLTAGHASVGIEAEVLAVAEHARIVAALGRSLVKTSGVIERQRRAKDDGEIARIEHASAIASAALEAVLPMLESGPTEREMARALDRAMEDLGAAGPSFETILASGPNAGRPHARPSDRRIG